MAVHMHTAQAGFVVSVRTLGLEDNLNVLNGTNWLVHKFQRLSPRSLAECDHSSCSVTLVGLLRE